MIVEMAVTSSSLFPVKNTCSRQITVRFSLRNTLSASILLLTSSQNILDFCIVLGYTVVKYLFRTSEERNDHSISGQFLSCVFSYAL